MVLKHNRVSKGAVSQIHFYLLPTNLRDSPVASEKSVSACYLCTFVSAQTARDCFEGRKDVHGGTQGRL